MKLYIFPLIKEVCSVYKKYFLPLLAGAFVMAALDSTLSYAPSTLTKVLGIRKRVVVHVDPAPIKNPRAQQTSFDGTKNTVKKSFTMFVERIKKYVKEVSSSSLIVVFLVMLFLYAIIFLGSLGFMRVALLCVRDKNITWRDWIPYQYFWLSFKASTAFMVFFLFSLFFIIMIAVIPFGLLTSGLIKKLVIAIIIFLFIKYMIRYLFYTIFILDNKAHTVYTALQNSYEVTEGKVLQILKVFFMTSLLVFLLLSVCLYGARVFALSPFWFMWIVKVLIRPCIFIMSALLYEKITDN